MADVSVEFGAKDVGLSDSIKKIQNEMENLETAAKAGESGFESFEQAARSASKDLSNLADIAKSAAEDVTRVENPVQKLGDEITDLKQKIAGSNLTMSEMKDAVRELRSLEALQSQVSRVKDELNPLGKSAEKSAEELKALAAASAKAADEAMPLNQRILKIQLELIKLKSKAENSNLTMEELEATLKQIGSLESTERRLKGMGQAASDSSPQIKNLGQQLDNAGDKAQSIGNIFDAEFAKIAGAFTVGNLAAQGFQKVFDIALNAARQVVQGFSDAIDLGGRLDDLSKRTGETAGKLLLLENAFVEAGLSADQVGAVINKLQNFMFDAANGGDRQRAAMAALGISMSELEAKTPTEQMGVFARAISGIQDPTARAAAASEFFGEKLGGKLLPLLTEFDPALQNARNTLGSLEEVMDENAATFAAAGDTIDRVKGKMMAFSAGLLSETIPAVRDLGEEMSKVDAAGLGETVGRILSPAIRSVTTDINILTSVISALLDKGRDLGSYLAGGAEQFKNIALEANKYLQILAALTPGGLNPVNLAIKGVAAASNELSGEAAIASDKLKETGTAAEEAGKKMQGAGEKADTAGQSMAESFSLGADFAPQLQGIANGWSKVGDEISGTKPLLEGNFSLADSIAGKTDDQAQSIGGVNEELKTSADLNDLIENKVAATDKKLEDQKAKQAASNEEKQKSLELDLKIAEALAGGNEEQAKALQYQKDFNGYLKQAQDAGMGDAAEGFATAMARAAGSAKDIKEELTESAKLFKSIEEARAKDAVDPGGRNAQRVQDAIGRGDFAGAERAAGRIAAREENRANRAAAKQAAAEESSKSLRERLADTSSSLRDRFNKTGKVGEGGALAGAPSVDKPGRTGQTDKDARGKNKTDGKSSLDSMVESIHKLLEKIEPRLPVAALTA
jgi:predicted  nucleic acid-binding Zn-ribbon protein